MFVEHVGFNFDVAARIKEWRTMKVMVMRMMINVDRAAMCSNRDWTLKIFLHYCIAPAAEIASCL